MRCGGQPATSWPAIRKAPEVGAMAPLMVRASVVLPAPLAPRMATACPPDRQIDALQDAGLAVAGANSLQFEQGRVARSRERGDQRRHDVRASLQRSATCTPLRRRPQRWDWAPPRAPPVPR